MFPNTFIVTVGKAGKDLKNNSICTLKKVDKENVEKSLVKIKENVV